MLLPLGQVDGHCGWQTACSEDGPRWYPSLTDGVQVLVPGRSGGRGAVVSVCFPLSVGQSRVVVRESPPRGESGQFVTPAQTPPTAQLHGKQIPLGELWSPLATPHDFKETVHLPNM